LFIVDPVYDFLDALGRNKQRDINRILYPLSELAHQTQTTVLLLTHLQKFKSGRPVQLLGSIAFQRTADSVYLVERVSESGGQRRRLVPARIGWRVAGTSVDFFIRENSELKLPYIAWGAVEPHEPLNVAVDRRGRPPVIGAETERVLVERLRIEPANLDELHALVPDPKPSKRTLSRYIDAHHGWIKQPGGRARLAVLREPPQFQSD
jgi:hypothetical protein